MRISTFKYAFKDIAIKKFIRFFLDSKKSKESNTFDPQIYKALSSKRNVQEFFFDNYKNDLLFIEFFKKKIQKS